LDRKVIKKDSLSSSIAVVVGTRPGIIKFSPVIRALEEQKVDYKLAHTGQHYSYNMDKEFFEDLMLPAPDYTNNNVKEAKLHGEQTAEMLKGLEEAFLDSKPGIVIVGGDANTNLAGALAARKLGIEVAHMEAGLRSDDWRMPEEHNRVMIDHISEYLFPPTENTKQNLIKDNVKGEITVTGNTIVDAVKQNLKIARKKSSIFNNFSLNHNKYFVFTAHREENVDNKSTLEQILDGIDIISTEYNSPIIFPIHPRTEEKIKKFNLQKKADSIKNLQIIEPLGYLDFLLLLSEARLALTDSGGIQEEACVLEIPCVTLRTNTERPETVEVGANVVAGTRPTSVIDSVKEMLIRNKNWKNPFGDGSAGERIVRFLQSRLN